MAVNEQFLKAIKALLPAKRIIEDITRRRAYGTDASFYQMVPELVLKVETQQQMQKLIKLANTYRVAITFRAAGTSLSGQAISNSVLVMLSEDWINFEVLEDGEFIRLQPGIVGANANKHLQAYQRKIGPDPASINTCKVGGIAANNASGMCCGVSKNSYYSLRDITLILSDGTILDTSDEQSVKSFRQSHAVMLSALDSLSRQVKADSELHALIKHKYRLKNTTGYAINSLIDFEDPIDVLTHLMIGSEGTLGFIADITYKTVHDHPHKASGLYAFATPDIACKVIEQLSTLPVEAVELLDQRAINSVKGKQGLPDSFCDLASETTTLLIETRAKCGCTLKKQISQLEALIAEQQPVNAVPLTTDTQLCEQLWAIRKATFPAVGAVRETGTTVIIEDVSFPLEKLAEGIIKLHALFDEFNYDEAIIFGHALAGNIHFVFTQSFETDAEIKRYDAFMQKVANLVAVEYGGSLKAEHGTGRNMAPFVELEWGETAYQVMQRIKKILDPKNILNPGVILNDDKDAHISNLKQLPKANDIVDKCIECGFCEPVCPSKDLTLTPRQRIALWRRVQALKAQTSLNTEEQSELASLEKHYQYLGLDTCAATGLCAQRCPVGINTGDLVRELRSEKLGKPSQLIAQWTANHFDTTTSAVSMSLQLAGGISKLLGKNTVNRTGKALRNITSLVPLWHSQWPSKSSPTLDESVQYFSPSEAEQNASSNTLQQQNTAQETSNSARSSHQVQNNLMPVIFFPSCASRTMGPTAFDDDKRSLTQVTADVFDKAGYQLILPEGVEQQCCGMPFHSKGFSDLAQSKGEALLAQLKAVSNNGDIPIVIDTSPCNLRLREIGHELPIFELTDFCAHSVLDKLSIQQQQQAIALHVTCSSRKAGIADSLRKVATACAAEVIEPENIECCGFAGDKGFTLPELNASALANLKPQVEGKCIKGFSNSRTCEIGLSHHSGIDYKSLIYLLDSVSEPKRV